MTLLHLSSSRRPLTQVMTSDVSTPGPFLVKYTAFLQRTRYWVVGAWVLVFIASILIGPRLLGHTSLDMSAPPGSDAAIATNILQGEFPMAAKSSPILLLLAAPNNQSLIIQDSAINKAAKSFTDDLTKKIFTYNNSLVPTGGFINYFQFDPITGGQFVCQGACNQSATIMLINVQLNSSSDISTPATNNFVDFITSNVTSLQATYLAKLNMTASLTGTLVFGKEIETGTEHDLLLMDGIAFPVALITLAWVLKSARLLILPVLSMFCSILLAFTIMYPVALSMPVISFAPSMMMSATIAMSIDYSLFLLSRYREELKRGRNVQDAVLLMLWSAGHTITVSGCTLALCFFGLCFFPVSLLRTPGMGAGISILSVLLCNLTLIPAMLLAFNNFFKRSVKPYCCRSSPQDPGEVEPLMASIQAEALHMTKTTEEEEHAELRKKYWYKFGRLLLKNWVSIAVVLVVTALAIPCGIRGIKFDRSSSIINIAPRTAESTKTYLNISETFGPGWLFPYDVVMVANKTVGTKTVLSDTAFTAAQGAIELLKTISPKDSIDFDSIVYLDGINVSYTNQVEPALEKCDKNPNQLQKLICAARGQYVNDNATALFFDVRLKFDPFSTDGVQWLQDVRSNLSAYAIRKDLGNAFSFYIANGATISNDIEQRVYELFPTAVGVTTAVVFVLVGLAFQSISIPLRAIYSIALTVAFVYGCAVWVFQDGALNWLHVASLSGSLHALSWMSPVMAFSVLVGLGLDYDVFLLSRIVEYRRNGYSDHDSILFGLARTGGIITAAGIIMAIAFVGLLFSAEAVLNQLSFFLVLAVLVDTFIIRSAVVPALMRLIGRFNWWPSRVPPAESQEE
eukprot:m.6295 g.6295  ORF g.6295 m.6295 type:complete len:854 (+) comp5144_c0_seq1:67-2628(+)